MKGVCQECKTEYNNFTMHQKYCSYPCRIKGKNKELMASWEKHKTEKNTLKHPWRDFRIH
jgi:hypothetical protein